MFSGEGMRFGTTYYGFIMCIRLIVVVGSIIIITTTMMVVLLLLLLLLLSAATLPGGDRPRPFPQLLPGRPYRSFTPRVDNRLGIRACTFQSNSNSITNKIFRIII